VYIPKHFHQEDLTVLHDLIEQYSFAPLVTNSNGQLHATHLPFYLDRTRGPYGTLLAHMARANAQWQDFATPQEALVIFQGPHAYVTPSWYESKPTNVPTWNMAVIHAYGVPRIVDDPAEVYAMLTRLVDINESRFSQPWSIASSDEYVQRALAAIVGFELPITRLEGKFKLSQNRSEDDRRRVVEGLSGSDDVTDRDTAAMMVKYGFDEK
jgi:transcriptional regulator